MHSRTKGVLPSTNEVTGNYHQVRLLKHSFNTSDLKFDDQRSEPILILAFILVYVVNYSSVSSMNLKNKLNILKLGHRIVVDH